MTKKTRGRLLEATWWTGCVLMAVLVVTGPCNRAPAQDVPLAVTLPEAQRVRFRNSDGSCVQCSIGMLGVHQNMPAAEFLLWRSEHGQAVRGGSGPNRVRDYCNARGIPAYNIAGDTMPWVEWACRTGRGCAIQWDGNHMITCVGMTTDGQRFAVCDNNSPARITWYSRAEFTRRHNPWVVVLKGPPPPGLRPTYYPWWNLSERGAK